MTARAPLLAAVSFALALAGWSEAAHAVIYKCPPAPATYANEQALAGGWQIWIEDTPRAAVAEWANGIAFYLPPVSGQAGVTELQCVARVQSEAGKLVTVEARKPLEGRSRCDFSRRDQAFNCAR